MAPAWQSTCVPLPGTERTPIDYLRSSAPEPCTQIWRAVLGVGAGSPPISHQPHRERTTYRSACWLVAQAVVQQIAAHMPGPINHPVWMPDAPAGVQQCMCDLVLLYVGTVSHGTRARGLD